MPALLVVHHTTSPAMDLVLEAALRGCRAEGLESVEVKVRPALSASVIDVLEADGFLLSTPANIGYMSGALKFFFDNIFYPTLTAKVGRSIRPVRPREQRHDRCGPRRRVHCQRIGVD